MQCARTTKKPRGANGESAKLSAPRPPKALSLRAPRRLRSPQARVPVSANPPASRCMSQPRIALGALVGGAIGFWVAEQFAEYYRVRARARPRTSNCPPPNPLE